jgi:hypothetical protein
MRRHFYGFLLLGLGSTGALGGSGVGLANGPAADLAQLATGQQVLLSDASGGAAFAGNDLALEGVTALAGLASEAAYLAVIDGQATAAGETAKAGWMLLFPALSDEVFAERFDAKRLAASLPDAMAVQVSAMLDAIAEEQERLIFFGRYSRTNFNVVTAGSADVEQRRRSILGGPQLTDIRFGDTSDPRAIERAVVTGLRDALLSGEPARVAEFIDPTAFGGDLRHGADGARLLVARRMLGARNWQEALGAVEPELVDETWQLGRFNVDLRQSNGFVFVSRVAPRADR